MVEGGSGWLREGAGGWGRVVEGGSGWLGEGG